VHVEVDAATLGAGRREELVRVLLDRAAKILVSGVIRGNCWAYNVADTQFPSVLPGC